MKKSRPKQILQVEAESPETELLEPSKLSEEQQDQLRQLASVVLHIFLSLTKEQRAEYSQVSVSKATASKTATAQENPSDETALRQQLRRAPHAQGNVRLHQEVAADSRRQSNGPDLRILKLDHTCPPYLESLVSAY